MTRAATEQSHPVPGAAAGADPVPPRDLVDFHLRWREFRPHAEAMLSRNDLSAVEVVILQGLVDLADRVRDDDIH